MKPKVHPITDIRLPKAEIYTLPSGLRLCLVPGGDAEVVRLRIVWKGGETDCRIPHVARIAELLIPEASEKFPGGEIALIIDFNGARFNITTTHHSTVLSLTVLSSKLAAVLPVVADLIARPVYDEQTFGVMREIVAMRYATSLVDVDARAGLLINQVMCGKEHPSHRIPTPEEVREIPLSEVADFCRRTLRSASSALAFLSGNFTDENLRCVEEFLRNLPADTTPLRQFTEFRPEAPGIYLATVPEALQAGIRMGLPLPSAFAPEGVDLRNTVAALGGYFGSRLMKNIREDKGYTYGIQSFMLNNKEGASMRIGVQTDISTVDAVIEETRKEIRRLAEEPPCGEELERLRQYLALELAAVVDTPFSVADEYMRRLTGLVPADFFSRRVEALTTLSPQIISQTAAKYLEPDLLRISIAK